MRFVLNELLGGIDTTLPGFEDFTPDLIDPVLEEAAKVCEQVLFPINRSGDEEGCTFENGVVRTPKGFKEAYNAFRDGGWTALSCDPDVGGQGLPKTIGCLVEEMICSANVSFSLYPGLTHGAYTAIHAHGGEELRRQFLPKMVDGVVRQHVSPPRRIAAPISACCAPRSRRRRHIQAHRQQDFHLLRRARPDGKHHSSGARPPAGRAEGRQGHQLISRAQVPGEGGRLGWPAQRRGLRRHRA
jgi:hypothetical protein